jgi:hypothetical protein
MHVVYADSSAVIKLVQPEAESVALRAWLATRRWVISDLHRTELRRAARRAAVAAEAVAGRVELLLAETAILRVDGHSFDEAGLADPAQLRSLDALHLVVAQTLGPDLGGIVAYDERLLAAARAHGVTTWSPR